MVEERRAGSEDLVKQYNLRNVWEMKLLDDILGLCPSLHTIGRTRDNNERDGREVK